MKKDERPPVGGGWRGEGAAEAGGRCLWDSGLGSPRRRVTEATPCLSHQHSRKLLHDLATSHLNPRLLWICTCALVLPSAHTAQHPNCSGPRKMLAEGRKDRGPCETVF